MLRWSPEQLKLHQQPSCRRIASYAAAYSSFYGTLYKNIDLARARLADLPPVTKSELLERFDQAVTDRALKRERLESFLATASPDDRFGGRFHVLQTSGSTGQRGLVVSGQEIEFRHATIIEDLLETTRVRQVKVIQDIDGIEVRLIAVDAADRVSMAVRRWFEATLAQYRLALPPLKVIVIERLSDEAATTGKYRPVECRLPPRDTTGPDQVQ
jgi:hypothetical protein